jgi:membrane-bound lytic murein transglycosylase
MKKFKTYYIVSFALVSLMSACSRSKKEPDTQHYILSKHDELMLKGEQAMTIKMQLDTLQLSHFISGDPGADTIRLSQQKKDVRSSLIKADETMEDWMHQYKADYKGNSTKETKAYFDTEAQKLNKLDGLYDQAITEANALLQKLHVPAGNAMYKR